MLMRKKLRNLAIYQWHLIHYKFTESNSQVWQKNGFFGKIIQFQIQYFTAHFMPHIMKES